MLYDPFFFREDYIANEDKDGTLKLELQVPGATKDDLSIDVAEGLLRIVATPSKGMMKTKVDRSFRLPKKYDTEAISATVSDGILTVELPLAKSERPKRVAVIAG